MEDALVHSGCPEFLRLHLNSLNPCFNGRCTRTCNENLQQEKKEIVLILVLMEDALVLSGRHCKKQYLAVLILVLMEDALVPL